MAVIASGAVQSTDSLSVTATFDSTGAGLILVVTADYVNFATFTDGYGNTPDLLMTQTSAGYLRTRFWRIESPTVGNAHTLTLSFNAAVYPSLAYLAVSGEVNPTSYESNVVGTNGSGSTCQPGSLTPSTNDALVVLGAAYNVVGTRTVDSGMTHLTQPGASGLAFGVSLGYKYQSGSPVAINPTVTHPSGCDWSAMQSSFAMAASNTDYGISALSRRADGQSLRLRR